MSRIARALNSESTVYVAGAVTWALGLCFIFIWAPHPWGWEGFDHYHQLALAIAAGDPFPTMEVPWGYAYFLAAFYRLFGDHPWIPLVVQTALNACVPLLVYRFALTWVDRPTAILAAAMAGVFSFNTVYASTQSSDAVCTVIFMTALVAFATARRRERWPWHALVGLLTGIAPQFRPNLILVPVLLAAYLAIERRTRDRIAHAAVLLACAAAALAPWVIRNYRLTHTVLPTSVHGGVQLWYGTLQVGPYLNSRAYNPRAAFDAPIFDYTSLDQVPIVVSVQTKSCAEGSPTELALVYWTDHDPRRQRLRAAALEGGRAWFQIPAPGRSTVIYYYFDATWPSAEGGTFEHTTPADGESAPLVYFVSQDHLGDLDVHGDLLDVFDLVRIARHLAWHEPLIFADRLTSPRHGSGQAADVGPDALEATAATLARPWARDGAGRTISTFEHDDHAARIVFRDGSTVAIPRAWSGRITDVAFEGPLALAIMASPQPIAALIGPAATEARDHQQSCAELEEIALNHVFYREEPHLMHRYAALAFDNIRRDPLAFARASAYRSVRLFFIQGTEDPHTAQQFSRSGLVYAAATMVSVTYLLLFLAGVTIAWRRGYAILLPLALIAYVPLTLAAVLTNMRYTITVQPIVFVFVAVALRAIAETPKTHRRVSASATDVNELGAAAGERGRAEK